MTTFLSLVLYLFSSSKKCNTYQSVRASLVLLQVRIYRKGFIQAMKKARKEGLKIPISDQPITDFDLVKAQAEKDEKIQEEKNKINAGHGLSDGWGAVASMMGSPERKILKEREPKKWQKPNWLKKLTKTKKRQSLTFEDNDSLESSLKSVKV